MNILFDLKATQPNSSGKRHGGGKYGEIIFLRMIERNIKLSCFYDSRLWFNPILLNIIQEKEIPLFDIKDTNIQTIIEKNNIDRLYSCLPGELAKLKSCEVYGTIHGLREFETPFDKSFYLYKNTLNEILKFTIKRTFSQIYLKKKHSKFLSYFSNNTFHPITVSEHTKYAIQAYFPELKDYNIPVFYSPNTSPKEKKSKIKDEEKFFLVVSGNRWEKNNLRAIIAFDRLCDYKCMQGIRMKITGCNINKYHYKIKHPNRFDFLGYIDDNELELLYANAYVFIYPSLNEGFGYPPLEAMRYGTPVIASPYSSIAETCGEGAFYFNPTSIEEIMNRMLIMVNNKKIYNEFSQKSIIQYEKILQRQEHDLDAIINYICK